MIDLPNLWTEYVIDRRSDTITSHHYWKKRDLGGYSDRHPWLRRRESYRVEVGVAIASGHIELWNTNLLAFRDADVFPRGEVRSGMFYAQGEGDGTASPDNPGSWIISAKLDSVEQAVRIVGWATKEWIMEHGLFTPRTPTWNDHWSVDPAVLPGDTDGLRRMFADHWDSLPAVPLKPSDAEDASQEGMIERFWRDILNTPVQEQSVAKNILDPKFRHPAKSKKYRDHVVGWAEEVMARDRWFPDRDALEESIALVVP